MRSCNLLTVCVVCGCFLLSGCGGNAPPAPGPGDALDQKAAASADIAPNKAPEANGAKPNAAVNGEESAPGQIPAGSTQLQDGRWVLSKTTGVPARFVGRIVYDAPSMALRTEGPLKGTRVQGAGTGALIGPRHVLTAAHVIFDPEHGFPRKEDDILFIAGLNKEEKKLAPAKVVGLYLQKEYEGEAKRKHLVKTSGTARVIANLDGLIRGDVVERMQKAHTSLDVAVLLLDRDLANEVGGHFQYAALSDKEIQDGGEFRCSGYDACGEALPVGTRQLLRLGTVAPERGRVRYSLPATVTKNRVFDYPISLFDASWTAQKGGSGGPVWMMRDGRPTIVGVCTRDGEAATSGGVLLDEDYMKWIGAYVPKTHIVQKDENLHSIAAKEYSDQNEWRKIYDANRDLIGPNPHRIFPGQVLTIPK